jgi:DnaK suppressor protein
MRQLAGAAGATTAADRKGKKVMSLSASQRKHLERRLLDERSRAQRTLSRSVDEQADGNEQDRSGDLTSMPLHMADRGTDTMQQELDASNATRVSRELAEIDTALERLYQTPDKFGICEDTGKEIPFARLDIVPWARTCEDSEK